MRIVIAATACLLTLAAAASKAEAASCSSWKSTCQSRGGSSDCDQKFSKCMKTGTWTEGQKFGGATHTGVEKK